MERWTQGCHLRHLFKALAAALFIGCITVSVFLALIYRDYNQLQQRYSLLRSEYGQLEQRLRSPGADRSRMEQVRVQTLARVREMFNAVVADATVIKCPRDWQDFNNTCYRFSTESGGWHNANRSCVLNNATLAILSSLGQQEYVMNYDREKRWIGLTDLEELGVYRWVNGDRLVTGYWALGEPNNAGVERCVTKGARFHPNKWNNDVCTTQHRWICQITRFDYAARHFGLEALLNQ